MRSRPILRLGNLHQQADRELVRELRSRLPNGVQVVRLKKIKLALKDRIAALSASSLLLKPPNDTDGLEATVPQHVAISASA